MFRQRHSKKWHMEIPRESDSSLWTIYQSVREECVCAQQSLQQVINWSIASGALSIALLTYLVNEINDVRIILIGGWLVVLFSGLLGISQYAGEAGRMLRAGYYGRLLEAYHWNKGNKSLPLSLMWETFVSEANGVRRRSRRLNLSYRLSAVAGMSAFLILQFAPFWLASDKLEYKLSKLWLILPISGSILSIIFIVWQIRSYTKMFSPKLSGAHLLEAHNIRIQKVIRKNLE